MPMPEVWEIMSDQLWFIHYAFNIRIYAFVLMSNHFHLIAHAPGANMSEAMAWFMRETSRSITRAAGRINQTYGGRFFRCLIKTNHYYLNAYKYIYRNPVTAGLSSQVETYAFSSLVGLIGLRSIGFPVVEDFTLFDNFEGTLAWLNRKPSQENLEAVRRALKKSEFKLAQVNHKAHPLEIDLL
jgi:putative transposase